ncbi:hypothetical protein ABVK25_010415 [Lepraria finkii]|uniref:Uncharacterized protein n=1 Tax=Lepraria finkii TaxID=1340010 RepID=A0ABR4AUF4_9LECA
MSEESREAQKKLWTDPAKTKLFVGEFPPIVGFDWGLGGLLIRDSTEEWRRRDILVSSGLPKMFWFVDREAGLCGLYGGQVKPLGDTKTGEMTTLLKKAVYERSVEKNAKM